MNCYKIYDVERKLFHCAGSWRQSKFGKIWQGESNCRAHLKIVIPSCHYDPDDEYYRFDEYYNKLLRSTIVQEFKLDDVGNYIKVREIKALDFLLEENKKNKKKGKI